MKKILAISVMILALTLPCWGEIIGDDGKVQSGYELASADYVTLKDDNKLGANPIIQDNGWHFTPGKNATTGYFRDWNKSANFGGLYTDIGDYCHSFFGGVGILQNAGDTVPFLQFNVDLPQASKTYFGDDALLTKAARVVTLKQFGLPDPVKIGVWGGLDTDNEWRYGWFAGVKISF